MVDIHDPELIPLESAALANMLNKREMYVAQGRFREAHGCGTAILILWHTLKGNYPDTVPTNWGAV
jgi:hypothetical protein